MCEAIGGIWDLFLHLLQWITNCGVGEGEEEEMLLAYEAIEIPTRRHG